MVDFTLKYNVQYVARLIFALGIIKKQVLMMPIHYRLTLIRTIYKLFFKKIVL